jgi:hypothetical protein
MPRPRVSDSRKVRPFPNRKARAGNPESQESTTIVLQKEKEEMDRRKFSYLKLMAVAAVLAITLTGQSGLLSMTTAAQNKVDLPPREIDLRAKLKDKKFDDGRRVEIHALADGEKIVAEIKNGQFVNWFLVAADGTEVQGVVKKKHATTTTTATCTSTIVVTVTTTVNGVTTTTHRTSTILIPCPVNVGSLGT